MSVFFPNHDTVSNHTFNSQLPIEKCSSICAFNRQNVTVFVTLRNRNLYPLFWLARRKDVSWSELFARLQFDLLNLCIACFSQTKIRAYRAYIGKGQRFPCDNTMSTCKGWLDRPTAQLIEIANMDVYSWLWCEYNLILMENCRMDEFQLFVLYIYIVIYIILLYLCIPRDYMYQNVHLEQYVLSLYTFLSIRCNYAMYFIGHLAAKGLYICVLLCYLIGWSDLVSDRIPSISATLINEQEWKYKLIN